MKLDMHIHSTHSPDGLVTPRDIMKFAKKNGLDGLCIADHNTLKGALEAKAMAKEFDLVVVRGMEVSSKDGHVLAYGIGSEFKRRRCALNTVRDIRKMGGLAAIAHPFRWWSGVGKKLTIKSTPDALETFNARSTEVHNKKASRLRERMKVRQVAGSDAHFLENVGRAYIISNNHLGSEEEVLEAIRKGKVKVSGKGRTPSETFAYGYKTITQWMGRGFKKM